MAASWEDTGGANVELRVYTREVTDATGATTRYAFGSPADPGPPVPGTGHKFSNLFLC